MLNLKKLSLFMVSLLVSGGAAWGAVGGANEWEMVRAVQEGDHETVCAMLKVDFPADYCDPSGVSLIFRASVKLFQRESMFIPTELNKKQLINSALTVISLLQARADVNRPTPLECSAGDILATSPMLKGIVEFRRSDNSEVLSPLKREDFVEGLENCDVQ